MSNKLRFVVSALAVSVVLTAGSAVVVTAQSRAPVKTPPPITIVSRIAQQLDVAPQQLLKAFGDKELRQKLINALTSAVKSGKLTDTQARTIVRALERVRLQLSKLSPEQRERLREWWQSHHPAQ